MGTRKPNQRSSIYHSEADGYWHGWVVVGIKEDRSPDRRHRSAKTEAEVTRRVQELEGKRSDGHVENRAVRSPGCLVLNTWLTTIAPRTVAQSTIDSTYEPKVRRWIIPRLGKHRLDQRQAEHLDAFYTWLTTQGLKPNTVVQIHRIISRALKVAWKRGKVASNVASLVDAPIGEEPEIEPLTRDEARRILTVATSRRSGARWSVALAVGIRQSEAIGLRWQYVDLDAGTIEAGWQLKRALPAWLPRSGRLHREQAASPARPAAQPTATVPTVLLGAPSAGTAVPRSGVLARQDASTTLGSAPSAQAGQGKAKLILALPAPSSPSSGPTASSRPPSGWLPVQPGRTGTWSSAEKGS